MSTSATLPPKPTVFHGRDELVSDLVRQLIAHPSASLAVLGSGGMGKTSVAIALLHHHGTIAQYDSRRYFLSCEALIDVDSMVISLAKLLDIPASSDLLTAVVIHMNSSSHSILLLDNLESVWLRDGAPVPSVDDLLGRLAQIPSLSLVVTCRGTELPQSVQWANADTAILEPFSVEAALRTFEDKARQLTDDEKMIAIQLLNAVDRMPLAVSLLGQLARRGNSVSQLLVRWKRERTSLLRAYGTG